MQPCGSDRLKVEGVHFVISSRIPKGWQGRIEKTLTSPVHPGTAVMWEGECYEVLIVEPLAQQGWRYTLAAWEDAHAIRVMDQYNEDSERERIEEHARAVGRVHKRRTAVWLSFLTGLLPASVQNHIGSELGILPTRLTLASCVLTFGIIGATVLYIVHLRTTFAPIPAWTSLVLFYFSSELTMRVSITLLQNRPVGSILGWLAFPFFPRRAVVRMKGNATPIVVPEDEELRDLVILREPYITLLPTREQVRIAERFDYDYTRLSSSVAAVLLFLAILGIVTSFATLRHEVRIGAIISLAVAVAVAAEQIWRLGALKSRPVGSFLGVLARPFVKRLI